MGRLVDALDRYKQDRSLKIEELKLKAPDKAPKDPEGALARQLGQLDQWNPKLVVLSAPDSIDSETFKFLRAQILFGNRPRLIMVTSPFPSEGKTFVAANLAISLALGIDEHVLLVDCDLRRPSLHEMLGYAASEGLHEYLTGRRSLPELMIRTKLGKLSFLPAGSTPPNPTELLSSSVMGDFLREARDRYDDRYIVIDSSPTHVTAEVKALAEHVDGVVLVVMAKKTPRMAVEKAIEKLRREKILGLVFNGHSDTRSYKKYYDKYYGRK